MAKIAEIFKSIQGEGLYQGREQVFVRFYGCNLRCSYCDTDLSLYQEKSLVEVVEQIRQYEGYHSVSLTGGEPLLQVDFLTELSKVLNKLRIKVYLETNGVLFRELEKVIDYVDIISMDFKLPSAVGGERFWSEHARFLEIAKRKEIFVKAVVGPDTTEQEILQAVSLIMWAEPRFARKIQFILQLQSPAPGRDMLEYERIERCRIIEKVKLFEGLCRENGVNVRIMTQLHKLIGVK